jgi:hypothetical protein
MRQRIHRYERLTSSLKFLAEGGTCEDINFTIMISPPARSKWLITSDNTLSLSSSFGFENLEPFFDNRLKLYHHGTGTLKCTVDEAHETSVVGELRELVVTYSSNS